MRISLHQVPRRSASSRTSDLGWLIAPIFLAGVAGLGIGLGLQLPVVLLFVPLLLVLITALCVDPATWRQGGWALVALVAIALAGSYLMTGLGRGGVLADVWLAVTALVALPWIALWVRQSAFARALGVGYLLYLLFALASSLIHESEAEAAAYQFLYNVKLPALLLCGLAIGWTATRERMLRHVALAGLLLALVAVVVELAAPGVYRALALGTAERSVTPNPILHGLIPRKSGPYIHSGMLAMNASFAGCLLLIALLSKQGSALVNLAGLAVAVALVMLAGQQQELLGFAFALGLIVLCTQTRPNLPRLLAGLVFLGLLAALVALALGQEQLARLAGEWGVGAGVQRVSSARPIFYADGVRLANNAFPLGVGLGRFGSVGAQLFDRSLYMSLGYSSFWWYRLDQFLLDTYWPNIAAEAGWIGAAALLLVLVSLLLHSLNRWWHEPAGSPKNLWGLATVGQLLVLMASLTSPQYGDPSACAWLLVWVGIAMRSGLPRKDETA